MIDTAVHDAISHTVRIFDIDDLRVIFAARRRDKPSHLQNEPAGQIFEQRAEIAKQRGFVDGRVALKISHAESRAVFQPFRGKPVIFFQFGKKGFEHFRLFADLFKLFLGTRIVLNALDIERQLVSFFHDTPDRRFVQAELIAARKPQADGQAQPASARRVGKQF